MFVALLDDPEAKGDPVLLPDGSTAPGLPGFRRLLWDGWFSGSIGFQWQPTTPDLPAHVLGHIGYAVVPWKRGRGCATRALALLLRESSVLGWSRRADHGYRQHPSQAVILDNGGRLVNAREPEAYGGGEALRYRIALPAAASR